MVKPVAAANPAATPPAPVVAAVVATQEPTAAATTQPAPAAVQLVATQQAPAAPDQTRAIMQRCLAARLSLADTNDIVAQSGGQMDQAIDLILAKVGAQSPAGGDMPAHTQVIVDARDKARQGIALSLLAKAGRKDGERNEFSGMTMRELARVCLANQGLKAPNDPMQMVAMAFRPTMFSGQHASSDFAQILADVANKEMLRGHEEQEETFPLWTSVGTLTDFKINKRVDLNLFPSLTEVPEGTEYQFATMSDRGASIVLATYGKMFSITRQAVINDDLNCFTKVPNKMGRASKRTVGNLVYAILTANANMPDGIALFHASHGNLGAAAAPTVASVDLGRAAMALQKDPDLLATGGLNIRPAYFLVPVELQGTAGVLMAAEFSPQQTQRVPNHVRGLAQVVPEARLSTASAISWYLAANPNAIDTIEVAYLNGVQTPVLEQKDGWNIDGVEMKVRLDAGCQVFDFRGLYKNPGA
jgi:hypothetical protein